MIDTIIVNSAEIVLKGSNRRMFERQLLNNIKASLGGLGSFKGERQQASFSLVWQPGLPDEKAPEARERLRRIFGIGNFCLMKSCGLDLDEIIALAVEAAAQAEGKTMRVETKRSNKGFPMSSGEISRRVGAAVLRSRPELSVNLKQADVHIKVMVGHGRAYVGLQPENGPNGLPVGTTGRLACLLSGGIDSPVAAWRMMGRGCRAVYVHCHSYPYVGQESIDKVKRLAALLDRWQGDGRLYLVPFGDIQREIVAKAKAEYRVVLYRRMMLRLAETIARKEGALGLVTGDSVGQVASQTLENMRAVSDPISLPVYRPLSGHNKEEIVLDARKAGTYDLSIEPYDDCCSLFVPDHPATKARSGDLDRQEELYDWEKLAAESIAKTERIGLPPLGQAAVI